MSCQQNNQHDLKAPSLLMFWLNMFQKKILCCSLIITLITRILDTFMFWLNMLLEIIFLGKYLFTLSKRIVDTFMYYSDSVATTTTQVSSSWRTWRTSPVTRRGWCWSCAWGRWSRWVTSAPSPCCRRVSLALPRPGGESSSWPQLAHPIGSPNWVTQLAHPISSPN